MLINSIGTCQNIASGHRGLLQAVGRYSYTFVQLRCGWSVLLAPLLARRLASRPLSSLAFP